MAPEQAAGKSREIGPAADIYALGVILYEMLTGRPPFLAATAMDTLLQVVNAEPVPPRRLQGTIPRDLETICLKCLEKDPRRRYPSAQELADDLQRFLQHRPIRARAVGAWGRSWRWAKRRPALAALILVIFFGTTLGLPVVTGLWLEAAQARDAARRAQVEEAEQRRQAEAHLYSSNIARAQLEWRANNVSGAEEILARCPAERRGWEWSYLQQLCRQELLTLEGHTAWVRSVAYSPDGRLLASAGGGNPYYQNPGEQVRPGEVILWDAARGAAVRTFRGHGNVVTSVAFSPDGQLLASASDDRTPGSGTWPPDGSSVSSLATRGSSRPSPSVPTAGSSPPLQRTAPSGCGRSRAVSLSSGGRCTATRAASTRWPSLPMGGV
jgi:hypothetical protein